MASTTAECRMYGRFLSFLGTRINIRVTFILIGVVVLLQMALATYA
ncbi:MAG: hypothetical protein HQL60_00415 [Magnetococcales bacterium]|nr:hypothetical protein [Magnetococcales bacterium]